MDIKTLYGIFRQCSAVATDSRTLKGGELFFALKGDNFDGNLFAVKALENGAAYAVVERAALPEIKAAAGLPDSSDLSDEDLFERKLIVCEDTLETLQALARYHRSVTFVNGKPLTVIGLTGTNGKTTTKELVKAVLSVKFNVTATEGNLNNSIGVPLTLLKITQDTEIAVVEMGASHPGDIKELCSVCLPNYGLITNVGKAHLLGFGSFEGVMKAKGELYDYIQRTADRIFLNADNPYLCRMASERPDLQVIPYGAAYSGAEILPASPQSPYLRLKLNVSGNEITVSTHLIGSYNADNVMAALAVGAEFGISVEDAAAAIEAYIPSNSRSQMTDTGRNILILDAYNANPTSMEAALDNFSVMQADRKIVMLGNMLELGETSVQEHSKVLEKLGQMSLEASYLVGPEFGKALETGAFCENERFRWFADSDGLAGYLESHPIEGAVILVKGSRGSRMEKVVPCL